MGKINKKIILAVLLSSVFVLGAAWFVFFVQIPKIKETADAIQKEKLDSFVRQQKSDKIYKLKKDLSDIESQKDEMDATFIKKNESVPFFRALEKIAEESGCQIKIGVADLAKVKFSTVKKATPAVDEESDTETAPKAADSSGKAQADEAAKADDLAKLKNYPAFNIETTGSSSSVLSFLGKMENIPYFVRVLTLNLASEKAGSGAVSLGAGTLSAGGQTAQSNAQKDDKNVKMSLLVIVYSNDKK
jgi:hypothetical protein